MAGSPHRQKKDQGVDLHLQMIKESFIVRRRKGASGDQQRRIQENICIGGDARQDQLIDEKGSMSGFSSAEDPGELLHRQTDEGDSEHQQRRSQEKICIGGEPSQAHLIDEKGSRSGPSSAEELGELLHRQTEEGRSETSAAEDPAEDLHRRSVTAGSTHRRGRIKEWIFIDRGSRRLLHRETDEGD